MGEMADYLIDEAMGAYPEWSPLGGSSRSRTCKYCGKKGLHWEETDSGWRLYNRLGQAHSCKEYFEKKIP